METQASCAPFLGHYFGTTEYTKCTESIRIKLVRAVLRKGDTEGKAHERNVTRRSPVNGMSESNDVTPYHHTQKAPWYLLLFAMAALFITLSWIERDNRALLITFSLSGLTMAVLGYSFQHLTVADDGDQLVIHFGPWPLFKKRIPYADIQEVAIDRTTILEGWGIHMSPRGGWVWNIWGRDCVAIRHRRGVTRIGTDDAQGLAEFLNRRSFHGVSPAV